jgi:hypothetical protein
VQNHHDQSGHMTQQHCQTTAFMKTEHSGHECQVGIRSDPLPSAHHPLHSHTVLSRNIHTQCFPGTFTHSAFTDHLHTLLLQIIRTRLPTLQPPPT